MSAALQQARANARTRIQRHHDMSSSEEHYALTWIRDHHPTVFDRAADYVDQIRHLDNNIRKETRA